MTSTLYEFGYQLQRFDGFKLIVAFIIPIAFWIFPERLKKTKREIKIASMVVAKCLSIGFLILFLWAFFILPVENYREIKKNIESGNVSMVEGEVCYLQTPSDSKDGMESFEINGIAFYYSGKENYGYCKLRCAGGVIQGNGQKLRITYYVLPKTNEKTICKIEAIQ
jgi:hypothetical protein